MTTKDTSVAPKERVNITYRPALGDSQERVELPLTLLVMSDFTLKKDERMIEKRDPISINKDNFDEVMKAQNIDLAINVPNKISGEPDSEMAVNLKFETLKDFGPEAIVQNTPELNRLLELRKALSALKGPLSNIPEFRKKIQELVKDESGREQLLKDLKIED